MATENTPRVLQDSDDMEDGIWELQDILWKVADSIQTAEPLQAKQSFEEAEVLFAGMKTYIEALNPSQETPADDNDTVRASRRNPTVRGNDGSGTKGSRELSPAARARRARKARKVQKGIQPKGK